MTNISKSFFLIIDFKHINCAIKIPSSAKALYASEINLDGFSKSPETCRLQ